MSIDFCMWFLIWGSKFDSKIVNLLWLDKKFWNFFVKIKMKLSVMIFIDV